MTIESEVPLRVGDILYGYCGGEFGRDSYDNKRVEAMGTDWVVARDENGVPWYADAKPEDMVKYTTPEKKNERRETT